MVSAPARPALHRRRPPPSRGARTRACAPSHAPPARFVRSRDLIGERRAAVFFLRYVKRDVRELLLFAKSHSSRTSSPSRRLRAITPCAVRGRTARDTRTRGCVALRSRLLARSSYTRCVQCMSRYSDGLLGAITSSRSRSRRRYDRGDLAIALGTRTARSEAARHRLAIATIASYSVRSCGSD